MSTAAAIAAEGLVSMVRAARVENVPINEVLICLSALLMEAIEQHNPPGTYLEIVQTATEAREIVRGNRT